MDMNGLDASLKLVNDKKSFANFVLKLCADLRENPRLWENQDLGKFLEALGAWIEDMDGYYENMGVEMPRNANWKIFADALMAARVYE